MNENYTRKESLSYENKKYIARLHEFARKEESKKNPIGESKDWPSFKDFSYNDLRRACYQVQEKLDFIGVIPMGISIEKEKYETFTDPKVIVYIGKEYRGEQELINDIFPSIVKIKGVRNLNIEYRIYN